MGGSRWLVTPRSFGYAHRSGAASGAGQLERGGPVSPSEPGSRVVSTYHFPTFALSLFPAHPMRFTLSS